MGCCCYRKGTNFQANHNTTPRTDFFRTLLLLPQRYEFSSKSQLHVSTSRCGAGCCCYRKGTNFQANHNCCRVPASLLSVVVATAKVRIFKQITTILRNPVGITCCCCYRKGTNFQANHNSYHNPIKQIHVVVATAKVRIFKQITTMLNSAR